MLIVVSCMRKYRRVLSLLALLVLLSLQGCVTQMTLSERRERAASYEELMTKTIHALRQATPDALFRAEAMLRLADELIPRTARVADAFACLAIRRDNFAEARRYFLLAIERDPFYARAYAHLAYLSEREGRVSEARAWYEKAMRLAPLDMRSRWNYGGFLYTHVSKNKGQVEFEKAKSLLPPKEVGPRTRSLSKP